LEAAAALLAEKGLQGMSMEEVAARSGVSKATIYRRWPSRGALALDAFLAEFQGYLPPPSASDIRGDLRQSLTAWVRAVTSTRAGRVLVGLLAEAQSDPALAEAWRKRVFSPLRQQHKAIVEGAVERGELPPGTDADLVLDLVFGAAYHRLLHRHLPLDERFAAEAADLVADGLCSRRQPCA
jgi:AcrR family transcriptional regulator